VLFKRTLAAFADTIVPEDDGPSGSQVGALSLFLEPFYRTGPILPFIGLHLNMVALLRHARLFARLPVDDRAILLDKAMDGRFMGPAYEGLSMIVRLAFYAGIEDTAGFAYMEYPGPNDGYELVDEPIEFLSETEDGNYP